MAEDLGAPLLTSTQTMLLEIGITADEGNVVRSINVSTVYVFVIHYRTLVCLHIS